METVASDADDRKYYRRTAARVEGDSLEGTVVDVEIRDPREDLHNGSMQNPPGGAIAEASFSSAVLNPYAYVGIPIDGPDQPPSHDGVGASVAARISARTDNAVFVERKRIVEAHARGRVEAEAKALEIARLNAKRRDSEGLDMRPHPGNRLEAPERYSSAGMRGEKAFAREGDGGSENLKEKEAGKEPGEETVFTPGEYQPTAYATAEYDCAGYKSVYDK